MEIKIKKVASVSERLKAAMEEAGKLQIDLVNETGLDRSSISKYLSGAYEPKQKAVTLLASALDVDEMWLWGYDVPKERSEAQKKNDDITKVIAQLKKDPEFFDVVRLLAELPADQYASLKVILTGLGKK